MVTTPTVFNFAMDDGHRKHFFLPFLHIPLFPEPLEKYNVLQWEWSLAPLPPLYNVGRSQPSHNIVSGGGRGGAEYLETIQMGWSYFHCKTLYFLTCPAKRVCTYMTHFQQFFCCLPRSGAWRRRVPVRNIAQKSKIKPPRYPPSRSRCPNP